MRFPLATFRERLLATLAYFDLFDYPLKLEELHALFLGEQPSMAELESSLREHGDTVSYQDGYCFLKGRDLIIVTREERERISRRYWKKVRFFLPLIQFVPFVRMVGVCNTLAINNAARESDIDLFIVARKGRLFFVRFLTVLLFGALGVRRHGNRIAGRFCLSFYVDETSLNLEPIQDGHHDIYLPYWVFTMKPLYGRETYERFRKENFWITKYFQRALPERRDFWDGRILSFFAWLKELLWKGRWGDRIEAKLKKIQMSRHDRRKGKLPSEASIVVSDHMLKFHNIDRRKDIAERFEMKMRELL